MKESTLKKLFTYSIILLMFTGALCTSTQGTLLSKYIDFYGLESTAQGLTSSMQSAGNLMALFLIGLLVGKLLKTSIVMISAVSIPIIFLLLGSKPAFPVLLIAFMLFGIAFGFQDSLASALMVDLNPEKSGMYMNLLHGVFGLGGLIGPVLFVSLMKKGLEWNGVLLLVACFCCVSCAIYILLCIKVRKYLPVGMISNKKIEINDIKKFVSERRKMILLICAVSFGAHQIGISSWINRYVADYIGDVDNGALSLSMFWVGTAVSRLLCSAIRIRNSTKVSLGFFLTSVFILIGVLSRDGTIMVFCCLLAGLAEGPILPLMLDMSCRWECENTSLGSTMLLLAHYCGFLFMPLLIGKLAALDDLRMAMLLPVAASLIGTAFSVKLIKYESQD
jgi:MFS family permease